MTLPPEKLGDKGQRYEVRAIGYPEDGENVIGWATTRAAAAHMAASIGLAPECKSASVVDRWKADHK